MADSAARYGGGSSPLEAELETKRRTLRRALKASWIRQKYHPDLVNPAEPGGHIFDTGYYRYQAMLNTQSDRFTPNLRSFARMATFYGGPFLITVMLFTRWRMQEERDYREGKVPYNDLMRQWKMFNA